MISMSYNLAQHMDSFLYSLILKLESNRFLILHSICNCALHLLLVEGNRIKYLLFMEPVGSLLRLPTHTKLPYMELHGATKLIFIYDNIFLVVKPNPACV